MSKLFQCENCLNKSEEMKRCGRCKTTFFCSLKCQKYSWKKHKVYCLPRKDSKTLDEETLGREIESNVQKCEKGGLKSKKSFVKGEFIYKEVSLVIFDRTKTDYLREILEKFSKLGEKKKKLVLELKKENHDPKFMQEIMLKLINSDIDINKFKLDVNMAKDILLIEKYSSFRNSYEEFSKFIGFRDINDQLSIALDVHSPKSYTCVDEWACRIKHHCSPNCCYVNIEGVSYVFASRDIKEGEYLHVSFLPGELAYRPTKYRREYLKDQHFIDCKCDRCTISSEYLRRFRCLACKEGFVYLSMEALRCDSCLKEYSKDSSEKLRDFEENLVEEILKIEMNPNILYKNKSHPKTKYVEGLLFSYFGKFIKNFEYHWIKHAAHDVMIEIYGVYDPNNLGRRIYHSKKILESLKFLKNYDHSFKYYFQLGELYLKAKKRKTAKKCYEKGNSLLKSLVGTKHYIYLHVQEKIKKL